MKNLDFLSSAVALTALLGFPALQLKAQSEWTNPQLWSEQVNDATSLNIPVKDTVIIEGFDESELSMTKYSVTKGNHDFFYPSETGIKGASSSKAIRIYPGTALDIYIDKEVFGPLFGSWNMMMRYAVQNVNKADVLSTVIESAAVSGTFENSVYTPSANNSSYGFSDKKGSTGTSYYVFRKVEVTKISLSIVKKSGSSANGYYCIDNISVVAKLPPYTRLNGEGNWNDYKNWSHFIPQGKRNALVQGPVSVDSRASCNQLIAYQSDIRVTGNGKLAVKQFTAVYPFALKGKWFFVSFPFDVYKSGIDERFTLGDASTVTSGGVNNVLYVMEYDSHRRVAESQTASEWKSIGLQDITDDEPVMRKGKGYLVALDETADVQELCFTSARGAGLEYVPESVVPIEADDLQGGKAEDNGWILCGNPYPSALSLQDIQPNPDLDGYVYVYDGARYQPYAIGSSYQLPPFSAFFVKAARTTELSMVQQEHTDNLLLRSAGLPYAGKMSGPQPTAVERIGVPFSYRLVNGKIELNGVKGTGHLSVYDMGGKEVQRHTLGDGYNLVPLPDKLGIHVIHIETDEGTERIKYK